MRCELIYIFAVFSVAYLSACRASGKMTGGCSAAQATVDDASALVKATPVVPAGGFVNVGSRSCTATFMLLNSSDTSLTLNAYSAQHCFAEDKLDTPALSISLHVPASERVAPGYLKNLKVNDDFFTRRSAFLSEVRALGSADAIAMAERATKIQLYADRGIESLDPSKSIEENERTGSSDEYRRNVCISSAEDKLNVAGSQEACWSALDTTVRIFELKASDVGSAKFNSVRRLLEAKKRNHSQLLSSYPSIAREYDSWSRRIAGQIGGWRLLSYVEIPAFLNKEVCGKYLAKDSPEQSICAVREGFLNVIKKHLVETDTDGKRKNALDHAQDLGFGLDTPFVRVQPKTNSNYLLKDLYMFKASDVYYAFMNQKITALRAMFPTKDDKIMALPKQFSIAANPVLGLGSGNAESVGFGLIDSSALLSGSNPLPSKGVRAAGVLRFYLAKNGAKVNFGPTDSGAMLTLSGVIPLLVLNTVDGNPTSGGSAILALPDAGSEEQEVVRSGRGTANTARVAAGGATDTRINANDALLADRASGCL
ncbi:MAG: hypothetical protein FJY29_09175 [Betaproteobacteria bacterium]|nr:hypothetical protein [Betaproteobacteria bacterium]